MTETTTIAKALLDPPSPKRRNFVTSLTSSYSEKLGRSVYAYGIKRDILRVDLEFDVEVSDFNLEPIDIEIRLYDGKIATIPPLAAALGNRYIIYFDSTNDSSLTHSIEEWCEYQGMACSFLSNEYFNYSILRHNRKRLLHHISSPGQMINGNLEKELIRHAGIARSLCFEDFHNRFTLTSHAELDQSLARLIRSKELHADIGNDCLNLLTRISLRPF